MNQSEPSVIDRTAIKTREWIAEVDAELAEVVGAAPSRDHRPAYRALKAVLHTIRDRITVDEAAQLASQLPELLRGAYYENWVPSRTPERYRDVHSFLRRVADRAGLAGETEASFVVPAVMEVLRRHISRGEIEDVLAGLPADIRALLS